MRGTNWENFGVQNFRNRIDESATFLSSGRLPYRSVSGSFSFCFLGS
jgi:hypothetical protein